MRKMPHRGVLLLVFAIGLAACRGRTPTAATPTPPSPTGAPTVTAVAPATGSTVRPTPVTIKGTGFVAGATVTVGAAAATATVVNSTTIAAIIPARAPGSADVVVTNPTGSSGTLPGAFSFSVDEPFTLTPSTNMIDAGGEMTVSWTAPAGRAGDWIAVFRVGATYEDDWYVMTDGATSGTLPFTMPTRPGQYEFRYLVDDRYRDVARSGPITVR